MTPLRPLERAAIAFAVAAAMATTGVARADVSAVRTVTVEGVTSTEPLIFDGRIEAIHHAEVANRIDGIVTAIHFTLGQTVEQGDLLLELAPEAHEAAVRVARAELDRASADLEQSQFVLDQRSKLRGRSVSELKYREAVNAVAIAEAKVAQAEAELTMADLDLARTRIMAPIAGRIGAPLVALGAFVEAESGRPLARIVQLDPVRVVYDVPYDQRLRSLAETEAETVDALLNSVTIQLELPSGALYPPRVQPTVSGASIDPDHGTVAVAAVVPNPDAQLLPGLPVRVLSEVAGGGRTVSSIPRDAVRTDAAGLHVLVIQASGVMERRPISILRTDQGHLWVGGVFDGETVVVGTGPDVAAGMIMRADTGSEHR